MTIVKLSVTLELHLSTNSAQTQPLLQNKNSVSVCFSLRFHFYFYLRRLKSLWAVGIYCNTRNLLQQFQCSSISCICVALASATVRLITFPTWQVAKRPAPDNTSMLSNSRALETIMLSVCQSRCLASPEMCLSYF